MRGKILFFVKCRACVLPHRLMATTWQRSPGCWSFLDARADFSLSGRLLDVLGLLSGPRAPVLEAAVDKKRHSPRFLSAFGSARAGFGGGDRLLDVLFCFHQRALCIFQTNRPHLQIIVKCSAALRVFINIQELLSKRSTIHLNRTA